MNIDGNNNLKPFDQDLNTYDNVNFTRVDVSGAIVDNSQLATKLYVDTHGGGGGGDINYVGTTPATNYIYKSSTSDGKSAVKSNIVDTGSAVVVMGQINVGTSQTSSDIFNNGSSLTKNNFNTSQSVGCIGFKDNWATASGNNASIKQGMVYMSNVVVFL